MNARVSTRVACCCCCCGYNDELATLPHMYSTLQELFCARFKKANEAYTKISLDLKPHSFCEPPIQPLYSSPCTVSLYHLASIWHLACRGGISTGSSSVLVTPCIAVPTPKYLADNARFPIFTTLLVRKVLWVTSCALRRLRC